MENNLAKSEDEPIEISEEDMLILNKIEEIGEGPVGSFVEIGIDFEKFNEFIQEVGLEKNETALSILGELAILKSSKESVATKSDIQAERTSTNTVSTNLKEKDVEVKSKSSFEEVLEEIVIVGRVLIPLVPFIPLFISITAFRIISYFKRSKKNKVLIRNAKGDRIVEVNREMSIHEITEAVRNVTR